MYSAGQGRILTASMLTEAASLLAVSRDRHTPILWSIPSVMVIPVNVQDLLAFHAQNPASIVSSRDSAAQLPPLSTYPERTHSVRPG